MAHRTDPSELSNAGGEPTASKPDPSKPTSKKGGLSFGAILLVGVFAFAFGPGIYHDCRASRIRAKDTHYTGTVVALVDSHNRVNDDPVVTVTLEVDVPGHGPVRGEVVDAISVVHLPRFQPGSKVQVWIDPDDPTRMALEDGL